jgi:hypothetical protein
MTVYRYVNVSTTNKVGDSVTLLPTEELAHLSAADTQFDLQVGFGIEKYVDGKRVQVFQEMNPVTGTEIPYAGVSQQSLVSTTAALACDLASGCKVGVSMNQAFTHANPSNIPPAGTEVVYYVTRTADAGSFAMTWSSKHKGSWTTGGGTANQKCIIWGESDGTNLVLKSASGWY